VNPRPLTGLTPSAQLRAECPTCYGNKKILYTVLYVVEGEQGSHGHDHPTLRDCPDCGGTGRVPFGG
jgi:hypothetical protein